jgi:proliferating cell nuclear antigen
MIKDIKNESSYVLEIKTVQSQAFKILIEALKELLTDTSVEFDETGMKIVSMDTSHCVLAHLKLDANKFEFYNCESKIIIGINMLNFYKLIRTINSNDTLTLFIESSDINHLGIKIENGEKNSKTTYKLNLLDLDNEKITIDNAEFNTIINLPSVDFQKICRDMNNIAENVEIKNIGNQLILSCKGDFCNQETIIVDNDNSVNTINSKKNEIVQGVFNLKYLVLFTKCTNLCSTVELLLKNDYPLIIRYMVASLGELRWCISQLVDEF